MSPSDVLSDDVLRTLAMRAPAADHFGTGSVIQAHVRIESMLIELLRRELPQPEALDLERISFAQASRLCVATGVLRTELLGPLLCLNKIRNQLAHKLHAGPSAEHVSELTLALRSGPKIAPQEIDASVPAVALSKLIGYIIGLIVGEYRVKQLVRTDPSILHDRRRLSDAILALRDEWFAPDAA
jgi:hypothetical protein